MDMWNILQASLAMPARKYASMFRGWQISIPRDVMDMQLQARPPRQPHHQSNNRQSTTSYTEGCIAVSTIEGQITKPCIHTRQQLQQ